jgi:hypothetical protein
MERIASAGADNVKVPLKSVIVPVEVFPFTTTFTPGRGSLSVPLTTVPFICIFCAYTAAKVKLNRNKTDNNFFMSFTKLRLTILFLCSQPNDANIRLNGIRLDKLCYS